MGRHVFLFEIFYPILVIIGIPANLLTVVILHRGKCGLSRGVTRYMAAMALGDLMVLVFVVIVNEIIRYHFPTSLLNYTQACRFSAFMQGTSIQLSTWFTMAFTFDRFVAICCLKLKTMYCNARTATVVIVIVCLLNILINIPMAFRYESHYVLNNIQRGCRIVAEYFTSPAWSAHRWVTTLASTLLPIPLLFLMNSLTARHILVASRARRALRCGSGGQKDTDSELRNRRTSIILLFSISSSFVVLTAPITVIHICVGVTQTIAFQGSSSLYLAIRTTFLLMCTSSCTNTCIYSLTQRRFREEIKNLVRYPHSLIIQLCKC